MKCTATNCKCEATKKVNRLWGKVDTVGFCENHSPEWLNKIKVGEMSPETTMFGVTKSWYKRVG